MNDTYHKFKVLIIGDSGVGKTSLLLRHVDDRFTPETLSTIGVDYKQKIYMKDGKRYDIHIWDTAGQERFKNVVSAYYRDAHAAFIVFDLTNKESFDHIPFWIQTLKERLGESAHPVLILVGNKTDLSDKIAVKHQDIQALASTHKLSSYVQTSAKDGTMVNKMFDMLLEKLISRHTGILRANDASVVKIKPATQTQQADTKKCC